MKRLLGDNKYFFGVVALFLILSFSINLFGVGVKPEWFNNFEIYSDKLAVQTMECADKGDYKGNLVSPYIGGGDNSCHVYASQFGLQGFTYSVLSKIPISNITLVWGLKVLLALALVILLILFVMFIYRQFGSVVAGFVAFLLMLSDWLVGFSTSLYWVTFLFFLPFIVTLYLYPQLRSTKRNMYKFFAILFGVFLLKFLTGYEYISVVVMSVVSAIFYLELLAVKFDFKDLAKKVALTIGTAALAFVAAIGLHAVSLVNDYGSLGQALSNISDRGTNRSSVNGDQYQVAVYNFIDMNPKVYSLIDNFHDLDAMYDGESPKIAYFIVSITSYLLLPVLTLPINLNGYLTVILQSFFLWAILPFAILYFDKKNKLFKKRIRTALLWALITGLGGVVSWFILAPGHTYVHAHINGITYYLPFMLWSYTIVAVALVSKTKKLWRR